MGILKPELSSEEVNEEMERGGRKQEGVHKKLGGLSYPSMGWQKNRAPNV